MHFIKIACLVGPAGAQERSHLTDIGTACGLGTRNHSTSLCSLILGTMLLRDIIGMSPAVWSGVTGPAPCTDGTIPSGRSCDNIPEKARQTLSSGLEVFRDQGQSPCQLHPGPSVSAMNLKKSLLYGSQEPQQTSLSFQET